MGGLVGWCVSGLVGWLVGGWVHGGGGEGTVQEAMTKTVVAIMPKMSQQC